MPPSNPLSSLFLHDSIPNFFPSLLSFLSSSPRPSLPALERAHACALVTGAARVKLVSRSLVHLYSRLSLDRALALAARLPLPDPLATNHVLGSLARHAPPRDALVFYCHAANPAGCRPNRLTFPLLISAAKHLGSIHCGEALHSHALKLGFLSYVPVPNALVHMYASCDGLDLAKQLFDEMPERDSASYNSMIDGYVKSGDLGKAEKLFRAMPERSIVSWSTLLNGYVRNRMFHKGMRIFHEMEENGVHPDDTTIVTLLFVYGHFKLGLYGRSVHGFLLRRWLQMPNHVSSAFVNFYCKCGLLSRAMVAFDQTNVKDLICWNTLISGLGSGGRGKEALSVFSQMLNSGVRPDDITFVGVLVACAHSGLIEEGLQYFKMMSSEFGVRPTFAHYWCLVDLFVRSGRPEDALKVIQDMPFDSESAIWGAVIWLAKVHGEISVGEYLGRRLIELEPDNSRRYVPLVNLYAAASKWEKYKDLQEEMKARGLKKLPDCTLIDLNVVVHRFSMGDKKQPENEKIYDVLKEIAEQLKLQSLESCENVLTELV